MIDNSHVSRKFANNLLERPISEILRIDLEKSIFLLFITLSLITRLVGIGDRVVSHDESLHTQYSYQYYNGDGYQHAPLMHGPTLFHATAASFWLFGVNDATSRIPVALLGTVLVALPYFFRRWSGKIGAIVASFLLLISPYILYYSRYIRHDIYVIVAAVLTFLSIQLYLRERRDKYLWLLAVGLALMFATMETSFIYVAIFGSFLVIRLLARILTADWFYEMLPDLKRPLFLLALSLVIFAAGFVGQRLIPRVIADGSPTPEATAEEGFAADPDRDIVETTDLSDEPGSIKSMRWIQVTGLLIISGALFLTARSMRPLIDEFAEFDLVVLLTTLTLPTVSSFLIVTAGYDPLIYTQSSCTLPGQETMSAGELFVRRLFNSTCLSAYASSGVFVIGAFVALTLVVSILVGLWWHRRRWLIAGAIFHGIFILFFTSFFSNPDGWSSGMIRSLGYWLAQQEVKRADQPSYFYFLVLPLYEFLPLFFSILSANFWAKGQKIAFALRYWLGSALVAMIAYSLVNWFANKDVTVASEQSIFSGQLVAGGIIALAFVYWFYFRRDDSEKLSWSRIAKVENLFGFIPYLIWWLLLTWLIYSLAGEKMAWLSTHFIFPMVLLSGWYIDQKLKDVDYDEIMSGQFFVLLGVSGVAIVASVLVFIPLLLGRISLVSQQAGDLNNLGRFLGTILLAALVLLYRRRLAALFSKRTRHIATVLALFGLLSLLTIRFAYMAAFPNADYVTEFLVYAHGAPATKTEVLPQLEQLSNRLYGDKSIDVAFDNDSSWPYTWYLRDYPNRTYFGANPSRNIKESPVIVVGSQNWGKVEPILGNDYQSNTYTFLWWPMEEYRKLETKVCIEDDCDGRINWNAIFGDPNVEPALRRGLGNPDVRQALWDIFFYRDYEQYGQVYGGDFSIGRWPLKHQLRLYLRKDMLANLWDHGIEAASIEPPVDPYAENNLDLLPSQVFGSAGTDPGQLAQPRNMALGPDGLLYVVDSGNHRVQVFDEDGQFVRGWGSFGAQPGQFNEPWDLIVDESFVYVADTWNHRIQKFTLDGALLAEIGESGSPTGGQVGGGLFFGPRDIELLEDGSILVADTGNHRLQQFGPDGNFIQSIGSQGNLLGQFFEPVGIGLVDNGQIFIADTWNGRIQRLNQDLLAVSEFSVEAWFGESINNKPYLAVGSSNQVYVTDPEAYRVLIFDPLGQYLGRFGEFSTGIDGFGLPNGIFIDGDDNIYVADAGNNRILRFAPLNLAGIGESSNGLLSE